jgi:hypothetical protein
MAMVACPSISETSFGLTLLPSRRVAQVCLRSWNRMVGRAAFLRSGVKDRSLRLEGCSSVPLCVAKTSPCAPVLAWRRKRTPHSRPYRPRARRVIEGFPLAHGEGLGIAAWAARSTASRAGMILASTFLRRAESSGGKCFSWSVSRLVGVPNHGAENGRSSEL